MDLLESESEKELRLRLVTWFTTVYSSEFSSMHSLKKEIKRFASDELYIYFKKYTEEEYLKTNPEDWTYLG